MELRINRYIKENIKVSYASEGSEEKTYDVDCGEGINIVMIPPAAQKAFSELEDFDMVRPYPHSADVKKAICKYWEKQYPSLKRSQIILCDGSVAGLYLINRLFLEAGDRVLGYIPSFSEYQTDVEMYGCTFDAMQLEKADNYRFHAEKMIAMIKPEHKLIYIDNPNNPTGQVIPLEEITKILEAAKPLGIGVIVDEAYGDYMPKENSAAALCEKYDNLIFVKTFSKGFGLAGLRAGYLILPESLVAAMGNITNPYTMSALSRSIAAKTIQDEAFLDTLRQKNAELKEMILNHPWKHLSIATTTPTVSISMISHDNPDLDLAEEFGKRRVLVISGSDFHGIGKNFVRLRLPAAEDMPQVLAAMEEIDNLM